MPASKGYVPDGRNDLSQDDQNLLKANRAAADDEFKARSELHKKNYSYYMGDHPTFLKDKHNNVTLNLCKQAVDRTASFLVPEFPYIKLPTTQMKVQESVWGVWRENGGATLLMNMVLNGCIDGHVFVKVLVDEQTKQPVMYPLNADGVIVFWSEDERDRVLWYEQRWTEGKTEYRQDTVRDGNVWVIFEYKKNGSRWELTDELIWNYELSPIVDFQHLKRPWNYYGQTELTMSALHLQDSVNKVASDYNAIIRYHAAPKTVGTGFEANVIQESGIDSFWVIPDKDAKVQNLEMQSDLASSMVFLQTLIQSFYQEMRVVMLATTPETFRGMTNLGVRSTFLPMIEKNEQLRRSYARGILEICKRILMLMGLPVVNDIELEWGEAIPVDDRERLDNAMKIYNLGIVSKRWLAERLGIDYDTELGRMDEEEAAMALVQGTEEVGVSR